MTNFELAFPSLGAEDAVTDAADAADARTVVTDLSSLREFKQGRPKYPTLAQKWWS